MICVTVLLSVAVRISGFQISYCQQSASVPCGCRCFQKE